MMLWTLVQGFWSSVLANCKHHRTVEIAGTFAIQIVAFWIPSLAILSIEVISPSFARRHKIQRRSQPLLWQDVNHCAHVVFRNQLYALDARVALLYLCKWPAFAFRFDESLPPATEVLRDFTFAVLGCEVLSYYSHRLLHLPRCFRSVHKQHHRYTAPMALAAQYAHPLEHLLSNVLPFEIPARLLGMHYVTYCIFLTIATWDTVISHSGKRRVSSRLCCDILTCIQATICLQD